MKKQLQALQAKSNTKLIIILSIVLGVVAIAASLTTVLVYLGRKKDERELERYLDGSIL